jgi:hypothetical protein
MLGQYDLIGQILKLDRAFKLEQLVVRYELDEAYLRVQKRGPRVEASEDNLYLFVQRWLLGELDRITTQYSRKMKQLKQAGRITKMNMLRSQLSYYKFRAKVLAGDMHVETLQDIVDGI